MQVRICEISNWRNQINEDHEIGLAVAKSNFEKQIKTLSSNYKVVSMDVVLQGAQLLVISQNGFGKLTPIQAYRRTARGAKGVRTLRITDKTGPVAAAHLILDVTEVMLVSSKGIIIRMPLSDIPVKGRYTQGVWMMRPSGNDYVITEASMKNGTGENKQD